MNLYNYLADDENREKISKYIHDNMPELLECDPNNHYNNTVYILKRKYEDYFSLETGGFGWLEIDDENWLKERNYKYLGEINLRKQKLENINEKILENKL